MIHVTKQSFYIQWPANMQVITTIFSFNLFVLISTESLSLLLWHGMGDTATGIKFIEQWIREELNETIYIKSIRMGNDDREDFIDGYFEHPDKQIEIVCNEIKNDANLNDTFNAIGFSQGALLMRGLIQRCPEAKVHNFISVGGPLQGVFGVPNCDSKEFRCRFLRNNLNRIAYTTWMQNFSVQATYWHDPMHEETFRKYSSFLADINNERSKNQIYIDRLISLNMFVMVKFLRDTIVVPKESEWFGFFKSGSDKKIQKMEETELYIKDKIGLKQMHNESKLHFLEIDANHMNIPEDWFKENVIPMILMSADDDFSDYSDFNSTNAIEDTIDDEQISL